jgi:hypothetical protein
MEIINQKNPDDRAYIAGLNDHRIGLYARSLAAGKMLAVTHFRPARNKQGLVWITLAHEEG